MTASHTHTSRLARALQGATDLTYGQAVRLVRQAQEGRLLPQILDDDGMAEALSVLTRLAVTHAARGAVLEGPGYDNLEIHQSYIIANEGGTGEASYLMFDVSRQTTAGAGPTREWRAVRLGVFTPSSFMSEKSPAYIMETQSDILAALCERGQAFMCVIARLPGQAPFFAYGVEGVDEHNTYARDKADVNWAALQVQLAGTFESALTPLTRSQGLALVDARESFSQVAAVRGLPRCASDADRTAQIPSIFEPNPTGTTQVESFLRATTDEFVLTLVASPLRRHNIEPARQRLVRRMAENMVAQEEDMLARNADPSQERISRRLAGYVAAVAEDRRRNSGEAPSVVAEGRTLLGHLLAGQLTRYSRGVESGAFLYQMFLAAPTPNALQVVSRQVRATFGEENAEPARIAQPLHTVNLSEGEANRLAKHAAAFMNDLRPEQSGEMVEPFAFSTYTTVYELALLSAPPRN